MWWVIKESGSAPSPEVISTWSYRSMEVGFPGAHRHLATMRVWLVLSTLRQGADLDYELAVLGDGCADPDPEVLPCPPGQVFPRQAAVVGTAEWVESLSGRSAS